MQNRSFSHRITRRLGAPVFDLLGDTGLRLLFARSFAGRGVIFALHRVVKPDEPIVYPGYATPTDLLDETLHYVSMAGWEIVSLDQMADRLERADSRDRRFACFTFDDGYLDNLTLALPIFERYRVPMCVYLAAGLIDRNLFYWWGGLQRVIEQADSVEFQAPGEQVFKFETRTLAQKRTACDRLDEICHQQGASVYPTLVELFERYGVKPDELLDQQAMSWKQARELARHPLCTVGAHTVSHRRLCQLEETELRSELEGGRQRIESELGTAVQHLAYPFGNVDACNQREFDAAKAAGYRTAVTTRTGNLFAEHRNYMHCLPRRSVSSGLARIRNSLYGVESLLRGLPKFATERHGYL